MLSSIKPEIRPCIQSCLSGLTLKSQYRIVIDKSSVNILIIYAERNQLSRLSVSSQESVIIEEWALSAEQTDTDETGSMDSEQQVDISPGLIVKAFDAIVCLTFGRRR